MSKRRSCILSKFYIKPQRAANARIACVGCILSKFYIKPQPNAAAKRSAESCILSKFYIKPQPFARVRESLKVVSYRNSTSNHNRWDCWHQPDSVVSYRNSTSNHNQEYKDLLGAGGCILSKFYIKPQPYWHSACRLHCCILSKFYIKPQPDSSKAYGFRRCILSKFYIKPQQWSHQWLFRSSCILSKFYIKPQLSRQWLMVPCVVSYRNSTSNHNRYGYRRHGCNVVSYRNSTSNHNFERENCYVTPLYLIEILHQTTTLILELQLLPCCILSKFYIKPQRTAWREWL